MCRTASCPSFQLKITYLLLLVGTVGTTITPYMQLYIQSSVAEKGVRMEHYKRRAQRDVYRLDLRRVRRRLDRHRHRRDDLRRQRRPGRADRRRQETPQALEPFLGKYAPVLFGVGLIGASLLAAAVLPLSTAYAICESFGFERGVSHSFREAPIFQGLFTGMLAFGALVALIPGLPLIQLIVVSQIINGALLPIMLFFILRLVNDRRIMGKYVNGRWQEHHRLRHSAPADGTLSGDDRQHRAAALRRSLLAIAVNSRPIAVRRPITFVRLADSAEMERADAVAHRAAR